MGAYTATLLAVAPLRRGRWNGSREGLHLLITGRFDSRNWCRAHLLPLCRAECVSRVTAVVDGPLFSHPKFRDRRPPRWLRGLLGRAASKAVWMLGVAWRQRPDVVMAYHIFPGAISALLVARLVGARCIYQMTAGPVEVQGGGVATENWLLSRLNGPSRLLEWLVLQLCREFDTIVVRGRRAREYMLSRGAKRVEVIAGSIDFDRFAGGGEVRKYDLGYVGRLNPIKRPEDFLRVVDAVHRSRADGCRAVVVGEGVSIGSMRRLAQELQLNGAAVFRGHVERVEEVLRETRVFVLTSRSEGLSIALAEAMAAGAVPVVADVGDLRELVQDGKTGWCVRPRDFKAFRERIQLLLDDPGLWGRLSAAARERARENNSLESITARWERCLASPTSAPPRLSRRSGHQMKERRLRVSYELWQQVPRWLKRLWARPLEKVPPRHFLGHMFRSRLQFVEQAEGWPAQRWQDYQLRQLQRLCGLAYERSPYYRRVFDIAGFHPADLKSPDDLCRAPTIDRDTIMTHLDDMCIGSPLAADIVSTGGTGGQPLRFYIDRQRSPIEYAYLVASWKRAGYRLGIPMAVLRGREVPRDEDGLYHEYDPVLRHHYYSTFHMTDENMRRYLEHIRSIGPCFLHVYPSSVAVLANLIRRERIAPPKNLVGIIAESEIVYPEQRRMVQEVLGCRYFSCYGHSEKLVLAAECEGSTNYHVWPTYGHFELLDSSGNPVRTPGQRGEIVGTGFINTVVPFIRYRTGDWATYVADRCDACGRPHPVISDIRGHRSQEMLMAADGSLIPWTALNMHDDTFDFVRRFQFHQNTPGRAVLRIVPAEGFRPGDYRRIRRNLTRRLDGQLEIDLVTTSIPLSARGKAVYVDQEIDLESLRGWSPQPAVEAMAGG